MTKIKRKPIEKRPLYREEIGNAIREAIAAGDLKPGDRIVETQWAKDLGVSQSPVREAIRELEMMGLVENIPYQGCFVRTATKQDMKDAYRVRMYLEMLGVQDAVEMNFMRLLSSASRPTSFVSTRHSCLARVVFGSTWPFA
jgi:DNA-binding GntR family transcriptional regulator